MGNLTSAPYIKSTYHCIQWSDWITLENLKWLCEAIPCMQWYVDSVEANPQWLHPRRKLFSASWPLGRLRWRNSYSAPSRWGAILGTTWFRSQTRPGQHPAKCLPGSTPLCFRCSEHWDIFGAHHSYVPVDDTKLKRKMMMKGGKVW